MEKWECEKGNAEGKWSPEGKWSAISKLTKLFFSLARGKKMTFQVNLKDCNLLYGSLISTLKHFPAQAY